ncbi:MAG: type II toxin-antitoxin system RelE/ParE family toxin [Gallionellaceae bacterium]|jgi:plasmid stabilization system protein ParE|nr:type II toxin-antitoxin system RelE/ParE family toxin [Gallionellaceae bacterium]
MSIQWSDFALRSLEEIIFYYEVEAGREIAEEIECRIFDQIEERTNLFPAANPESDVFPGLRKLVIDHLPYVAFIRPIAPNLWEVVDIVHTSRKLPKTPDSV